MASVLSAARRVPFTPAPGVMASLRVAVFLLALVPLARLILSGFYGGLGANPVEAILRSLGTWTLVLLLVTLSITPLRWLTGWSWLLRLRRILGLFTFFYAMLHVTAFVWLDHWFEWADIVADVIKRPYLTFGFVAFVLLIPLAATSTNAMVRRLGGRNWKRLHRLVYAIAVLGVLHYWYHKLAKNDLAEPMIYTAVLGALLSARLLHWLASRRRAALATAVARRT
jgi:sulfoxide reductase heme-binding subunit YedZ